MRKYLSPGENGKDKLISCSTTEEILDYPKSGDLPDSCKAMLLKGHFFKRLFLINLKSTNSTNTCQHNNWLEKEKSNYKLRIMFYKTAFN